MWFWIRLVLWTMIATVNPEPAMAQQDECSQIGMFAAIMMNDRQFNNDREASTRDFQTALGLAATTEAGMVLITIFNGAWDIIQLPPPLRADAIEQYGVTIRERCYNEGW